MSNLPLPPLPKIQNPNSTVVFADIIIRHTATATATHPARLVIELNPKEIGGKFTSYVKAFFTGSITWDAEPVGFCWQQATRLVPQQSVSFSLVSQAADCHVDVINDLVKFTARSAGVNSESPLVVVSLSKLKLGRNFEMKIVYGPNQIAAILATGGSSDEVIIGHVLDGNADLFAKFDTIPVPDKVLCEPTNSIQIVECGEL